MVRFSSGPTFSGSRRYILFICTGNTCRSPMAYGILRQLLDEAGVQDLDIRTAGVMTVPGLLPTQECRQLLMKDGIDISGHRSCQLTEELVRKAEIILGMTSFHVQMALRMSEDAKGKTYLLKEFAKTDARNDQVQDPMGCTLEVYKKIYREIRAACRKIVKMPFVNAEAESPAPEADETVKPARKVRPSRKAKPVEEPAETPKAAAAKTPRKKPAKPAKQKVAKPAPAKPAKPTAGKSTGSAAKSPKKPAAPKKASPKKPVVKKPAAKKPAMKKPVVKKVARAAVAKKPATKTAARKTTKPTARKASAKSTSKAKRPAKR